MNILNIPHQNQFPTLKKQICETARVQGKASDLYRDCLDDPAKFSQRKGMQGCLDTIVNSMVHNRSAYSVSVLLLILMMVICELGMC